MKRRYLYYLLLTLYCNLSVSSSVYSGVICKIDTLYLGGYDFSESTTVHQDDSDIFMAIVVDPPLGLVVGAYRYPAEIAYLPDSTFEDLRYAPEDTTVYNFYQHAYLGKTYVVRTMEMHYAKFRFLQLPYAVTIIEYVYQPDGSRKLFDRIAVESYTWGGIKKLFQ